MPKFDEVADAYEFIFKVAEGEVGRGAHGEIYDLSTLFVEAMDFMRGSDMIAFAKYLKHAIEDQDED